MDIQTRKLNIISYLSQIQDESVLDFIEDYIQERKSKFQENTPNPFTEKELIERLKKSERDFEAGRFKTQAELEKLSDNW